jgi:hypothetical protein
MKVSNKQDSKLMHLISWVLFFNKNFMTNYATTIGETVYLPESAKDWSEENLNTLLSHEHIHIQDKKKDKLYELKYLFPQILAPLALVLLPFNWILSLSLFFGLLLPWPAPWRAYYERRGYTMTLAALYLIKKKQGLSEDQIQIDLDYLAELYDNKYFHGPDYYFMWPFGVEKKLKEAITDIKTGDIFTEDSVYARSRDAVLGNYRQD